MERQSKGPRDLEAYCSGGQGPPRAVAPTDDDDAQNLFYTKFFHASTCFEHHVLIVRRSKLYYTASGIITPIGGRPVHL